LSAIALVAFGTRLFSVIRYESVIHEFDPWFNFRATKYLVDNGWNSFLNWFDERAWYPLGRVVGVTVYPGIMITSALFHWVSEKLALGIDIRDICVFLAPVFAGFTAVATYGLARELQSGGAALLAAAFMAIVPGYISRSVAGSYDNEGIAIFLMMATFFSWIRASKTGSAMWGTITALFYFYMVASWGGYVFIINLIPLHAFVLLLMGRYSTRLYTSYCTFYILGTVASMTLPFVGLNPSRTSEHMAAMGVFCLLQLMALVDTVRKLVDDEASFKKLTTGLLVGVFCLLVVGFVGLSATGHIAPWAGRFKSIFDTGYARKHIPIIASVSEHQPTTWASFFLDLNLLILLAPAGLWICFRERRDEHMFAMVYIITGVYFAGVMVRLILTLAPIMCILGAMAVSRLFDIYTPGKPICSESGMGASKVPSLGWGSRAAVIAPITALLTYYVWHCTWVTSSAYSSPSIMMSTTDPRTGRTRIIDDFREAYYWLRRNTDYDAKVLAWWDYGYQMAGMADRTTIVDNNTWNNTHIAMVGKALALPEERSYPVLRQLDVDYILVLSGAASGFSGDDINKLLWMVRIAEGVFPKELRESDYLTSSGDYRVDSSASTALKESVLYKTVYYGVSALLGPQAVDRIRGQSLAGVDPKLSVLEEAYSTDGQLVRIFKVKQPDILGRSLFFNSRN
jgi:dolichyl-diphosphooligosaccharide--protein glycosyltransferase